MRRKISLIILVLSVGMLFACTRKQEEPQPAAQPAASQPPAAEPAPAVEPTAVPAKQPEAPPPAPRRVESRSPGTKRSASAGTETEPTVPPVVAPPATNAPATPPPPPPPTRNVAEVPTTRQPVVVVVPSGTRFDVRLLEPIDSAKNQTGDTFKASLDKDLEADGRVVAPKGSTVLGKLTQVTPPGRVEGRAAMSITLTSIVVGQDTYPIQANTLAFEAEKTVKEDAKKVGIGAGIGAVIGAIAGGGKGAAIGAAVGGGAGAATVLATKGKDVKFGVEDRLSFVLRSDLEIRY